MIALAIILAIVLPVAAFGWLSYFRNKNLNNRRSQ
jgi:uncharacterized membrane protein YfcA